MTGHRQVMRKGWRPLVALAASYLLVLQVLLAGLTVLGHAVPAAADGLAAVICTPDGIRHAPGEPATPADPHGLTCCLTGCSATGPTGAPPVALTAIPAPAVVPVLLPAVAAERTVAGLRRSPVGARAPPAAA